MKYSQSIVLGCIGAATLASAVPTIPRAPKHHGAKSVAHQEPVPEPSNLEQRSYEDDLVFLRDFFEDALASRAFEADDELEARAIKAPANLVKKLPAVGGKATSIAAKPSAAKPATPNAKHPIAGAKSNAAQHGSKPQANTALHGSKTPLAGGKTHTTPGSKAPIAGGKTHTTPGSKTPLSGGKTRTTPGSKTPLAGGRTDPPGSKPNAAGSRLTPNGGKPVAGAANQKLPPGTKPATGAHNAANAALNNKKLPPGTKPNAAKPANAAGAKKPTDTQLLANSRKQHTTDLKTQQRLQGQVADGRKQHATDLKTQQRLQGQVTDGRKQHATDLKTQQRLQGQVADGRKQHTNDLKTQQRLQGQLKGDKSTIQRLQRQNDVWKNRAQSAYGGYRPAPAYYAPPPPAYGGYGGGGYWRRNIEDEADLFERDFDLTEDLDAREFDDEFELAAREFDDEFEFEARDFDEEDALAMRFIEDFEIDELD